jgi:hypothetical protein
MSSEIKFSPSLGIDSFFGDEFFQDNERFLLFLKAYYEWLQTSSITLLNVSGTFQRGEQIVGQTSGATGIVKEVKDGSIVVEISTKKPFQKLEIVSGQTSLATGEVYSLKDNVVRASGNVLDYRDLETSVDKYVNYLKEELYPTIPISYFGNKPLLASKFKDFFNSKSNEQSYRFLFRLLYNEEIDFYYPGDDIIRSSDGNFEQTQIIRTGATAFGINQLGAQYERSIFDFLNKTIRGKTSGSLAFVVDIKKFFIGALETAELTLKLVSGDFIAGEEIVDIDDENLNATLYGIVAGFQINDGGSGYQVGDIITINGNGSEAQAVVSSIRQSPITKLKINNTGYGYRVGTQATINNAGTGGSGLIVRVTEIANTYTVTSGNTSYEVGEISKVSIVSRGSGYFASPQITLVDTTIESLGLLSDKLVTITNSGTNYAVNDPLVITANTGAGAVGRVASVVANSSYSNNLLFEDGFELVFEQSYEDVLKTEDWSLGSFGPIARVEFTNFGGGYDADALPTITVNTSTGANAQLTVIGVQGMSANVQVDAANNATGIGSIRALDISNFGINYTTATADATGAGDGNANLTPIISGIGVKTGSWLDDDGKVNYKILQDSYYYQDYSYVIKSGLTVEKYIDTVKKVIHPAGLQLFGELLLIDSVSVTPEFKSYVETLKDFIIEIYSLVVAGVEFGEFQIEPITVPINVIVEPDKLVVGDGQHFREYVIKLVPGGDDLTSVSNTSMNLVNTDVREFVVHVAPKIDSSIVAGLAPLRKIIVSFAEDIQGYSQANWAENTIEDVAPIPISTYANETFDGEWIEYPRKFTEVIVSDKFPPVADLQIEKDQEYVLDVPLHGFEYLTNDSRSISEYSNTTISAVSADAFDLFYSEVESATVKASPSPLISGQAESQRTPTDIFRTELEIEVESEGAWSYRFILGDEPIQEIAGMTIGGNTLNAIYDGQAETYENYTFDFVVRDFPKTYTEFIKQIDDAKEAFAVSLPIQKEYVNQYYSRGFGYEIYDEVTIATYENEPLSTFSEVGLEQYHADVDAISIPMFLSPSLTGQSEGSEDPRDIFRRELNVEILTFLDASISIEPYIVSNEITTDDIELDRELPVIITFDIPVAVRQEYGVVVSPAPAVTDATITFSSVAPQKFQAAEGIASAYGLLMQDLTFLEYGPANLDDLTGEAVYQGTNTTFGDAAFSNFYRTYPFSETEMVQRIITVEDGTITPNRELVVAYSATGTRPIAYFDTPISVFENDTLAQRRTEHFEVYYDTVGAGFISVFPSPLSTGQAITSKSEKDIFRTEMVQQVKTITPITAQSMADAILADAANETFEDFSPESENYGLPVTYGDNTFNNYFRTFAKLTTEMVRQIPVSGDASAPENHDRQFVVSYIATGFRFALFAEGVFEDYQSDQIATLADIPLNEVLNTVYDNTIKASPSPTELGFSGQTRLRGDVFQNEIVVKPNTNVSPYDTQFEDLDIEILSNLTFATVVPGTESLIGDQQLNAEYLQAPLTLSNYIRYAKVPGSVSSLEVNLSEVTLDDYSETPLESVDGDSFSNTVPFVVGTGTNFTSDYDLFDVFEANNEYFLVEAIANTTHMIVDRHPMSPYSGVYAYKQTF